MIIRVFRPTIHPGKQREFEAFLRDTAVPLMSQRSALVAQHVVKPRDPSSTEYVYSARRSALFAVVLLLSGGHGVAVGRGHDRRARLLAIATLLGSVGVVLLATLLVPT
jgi:hypothetical protein